MRRQLRFATLAITLVASACGGTNSTQTGTTHRSANTITAEEINGAPGIVTVYDAIQRLRPQWLTASHARTVGTQDELLVYLDTNRYGTLESLRGLPIGGVTELRYLSASEATNRYGTGHAGGAIVVLMSK